MTVAYLRDTASQAGLKTSYIDVEQIGWDTKKRQFVDMDEQPIEVIFKLYPWEWLIHEEFAPHLLEAPTSWLEAPWKMLLSNKAILTVLYEMYPGSPYLLEASLQPLTGSFVQKPLLGREGANVTVVQDGQVMASTEGEYEGPYVYQRRHCMPTFGGRYPVIGSWMVNGYACGMGIREDTRPITQNTSRFVPHIFRPEGM